MRKVIDNNEIWELAKKVFDLFSGLIQDAFENPVEESGNKGLKLVETTARDFILNYTQIIL